MFYPSIDAVITYVNDKDPEWNNKKKHYDNNYINGENNDSKSDWRFTDNDEAFYCIKSINKYAKFIRRIFFVISDSGQIPEWYSSLKSTIPIEIVYHNNIYPKSEWLPTFNSTSIEANLHNIKGLSEYFIYFNDDTLLGNKVSESDFIDNNGKLLIQLENRKSKRGRPYVSEIGFYSAWKNTNKMLDNLFPTTKNDTRMIIKHVPQIQRKSTHKKLNKIFKDQFDKTSESKFRNINIHNTTAGLAEYYELYTNNARVYDKRSYIQAFITNNHNFNKKYFEFINKIKPKFFNLQSTATNKTIGKQISQFLREYYSM